MQRVRFEIDGISYGWLEVRFISPEQKAYISASGIWEFDSPRYFLSMITKALKLPAYSGYVVFGDEPGACIVCLEKDGGRYMLNILLSELCSDELRIEWHDTMSTAEVKARYGSEVFFTAEIDAEYFAETVIEAFTKFSCEEYRKVYEKGWGSFPQEEFDELKGIGAK